MCVSYRALSRLTKPFEYPIERCDNTVEDFGDGAGTLFLITFDYAQGYHQIQVWYQDQKKLHSLPPMAKIHVYCNVIRAR